MPRSAVLGHACGAEQANARLLWQVSGKLLGTALDAHQSAAAVHVLNVHLVVLQHHLQQESEECIVRRSRCANGLRAVGTSAEGQAL